MTATRFEIGLGQARYAEGRLEEAYEQCKTLIDSNPDHGYAWELLGLVFRDRGQFVAAADALERASLLVPIRTEARIALATCYANLQRKRLACELLVALVDSGQLDIAQLLDVAAHLESMDQPRLAMEACRRASRIDFETAQIHFDMGFYAARSGCPPHVSEALTRRAIDLDPANVHYRIGLASLLVRLDRFEEAHHIVADISDSQIQDVTCMCCLERVGNLLQSFGDPQRAQRCRERLRQLRGEPESTSSKTDLVWADE
ncbi:MAG: tetratricopeptide repeat protein [Pirellulales bacterium]|nr:tetratricopeptide repeat protein [Pirellulales bacterium]